MKRDKSCRQRLLLRRHIQPGQDHAGAQAAGFAMIPQNWAFIFSARSPGAIRRAQAMAPLYMVMFPLLMVVAHYARAAGVAASAASAATWPKVTPSCRSSPGWIS